MDYFTADWHVFHNNILKYCDRTFKNVDVMHNKLIKNYNSTVQENDRCFFVGDMAMLGKEHIFKLKKIIDQLNGRKILILGNHDKGKPFTYVKIGFESVHTSYEYNDEIIIVHDPAVANVNIDKKLIVGHVHTKFKSRGNCVNVGVDVWDYKPVSLTDIMLEFEKLDNNKTFDQ